VGTLAYSNPQTVQSELLSPWPGFYLRLSLLGGGSGRVGFFVKQFDGLAGSGVTPPFTVVVLFYSTGNISGGAGVEGVVAALKNVCVPHGIYFTKDKPPLQLIYLNIKNDFFSLL